MFVKNPNKCTSVINMKPTFSSESNKNVENTLAPLPFPVTFVCRYAERWSELLSSSEPIPDPDTIHEQIINNEDCWIVLTYLHLKRRHLNVSISNRFTPGAICVASCLDFGIQDRTYSSFVVGCRGDGPKPTLCDFTIVQNEANVESETDVMMPLWPQPGLVPRAEWRSNRIENVVFKGWEGNLYEAFRSPQFRQELEHLGVRLLISGKPENGSIGWHDYSNADLVLAVRDLTEQDALVKPPSKLINAWIAGVPALLGPEPAFHQLRQSPLDYIEVRTPQEALDAIRRLQQEPSLYQQMIANGLKRAEAFTVEPMAQRWREVLAGPVAQRYERWCQRTQMSRMGEFVLRAFRQKAARAKAEYNRKHGYRIISGTLT